MADVAEAEELRYVVAALGVADRLVVAHLGLGQCEKWQGAVVLVVVMVKACSTVYIRVTPQCSVVRTQ